MASCCETRAHPHDVDQVPQMHDTKSPAPNPRMAEQVKKWPTGVPLDDIPARFEVEEEAIWGTENSEVGRVPGGAHQTLPRWRPRSSISIPRNHLRHVVDESGATAVEGRHHH